MQKIKMFVVIDSKFPLVIQKNIGYTTCGIRSGAKKRIYALCQKFIKGKGEMINEKDDSKSSGYYGFQER